MQFYLYRNALAIHPADILGSYVFRAYNLLVIAAIVRSHLEGQGSE